MKHGGAGQEGKSASQKIDDRIAELGDWRGELLTKIRTLLKEVEPSILEEWKWMGTPVWSHEGIVCTGESYKEVVKMTFAKGASLKDPAHLFNSSMDGNVRRAIDIRQGEKVNTTALKALFREAIALNLSKKKGGSAKKVVAPGAAPPPKKAASTKKAAPSKKAASTKKAALPKRATSPKKASSTHEAAPARKPAPPKRGSR